MLELEAQRNKKIRGWLVRILQRAYPAGLEPGTLKKQLNDLGYTVTVRDTEAALAYLKEDGFVENPHYGGMVLENEFYKLTTKGIDLAEGTVADPGVDL
ncbi:MAG: hypothetical protein IJF50_08510 [Peptococcaceae bacterium]|nr:hypothetical protein [Peptococcaceae bacterium]MBQ2994252.1 hypothetical protein [Peptococcaceae bacterium]